MAVTLAFLEGLALLAIPSIEVLALLEIRKELAHDH